MINKNIPGWDSLHPTQQQLYEILDHASDQESLTLESMRSMLGVNFLNTVVHHLGQLEKKGYIRKNENGGFDLLSSPMRDIIYLNLYGMAGCGPKGFFNEGNVVEKIPFPAKRLRISPDSFLVEAKNDSMEPMIHDGDFVLVDRSPVANGDIAVVVQKGEAKIKKVFRNKEQIVLQSLNSKYAPVVVDLEDVSTIGVVRGVVRSFEEDNLKVKKSR